MKDLEKTQGKPTTGREKWNAAGELEKHLRAVRTSALFRRVKVGVLGTQPLIVHNWSTKAQREMALKQSAAIKRTGKAPRDPAAEVRDAFYMMEGEPLNDGSRYGFPAAAFKHAAVDAGRHLDGLTMTGLNQQFFVQPHEGRLVEVWSDAIQEWTDPVRIGKGATRTTDLRYRPAFLGWRTLLDIDFWPDAIQLEQVLQCLEIGGTISGVGEWRPSTRGGQYGTFVLISEAEFGAIQAGDVSTDEMLQSIFSTRAAA